MDLSLSMDTLTLRLRRAYLRAHRRDRNTVLGFLTAQTLLAFFAAYLLDRLTGFPAPVRIAVTLGILGGIFGWQLRRNAGVLRRKKEPEEMARDVERRAQGSRPGGLHSMLVSATEFGILGRTPGSAELRQRVLTRAGESEYDPTKLVLHRRADASRTGKWLLATAGVYGLWALLGLTSMGIFFARALGLPLEYPTRTRIERVEAPEAVARFEDVTFQVFATGELPTRGMVEVSYRGSKGFDVPLEPSEENPGNYTALLERPQRDFKYQVRLGDDRGRTRSVRVVSPPVVASGTLTLHPPAYTGRSARTRQLGNFEIWQGGSFDLLVTVGDDVETCELVLGDRRLPLERTEAGYVISSVTADASTPFSVRLVGDSGVENLRRPEYNLTVREDTPPRVTLLAPDDGGYLAPQSLLRWKFRAEDDLGMGQAVLRAEVFKPEVLGDEGEVIEEERKIDTREVTLADLEGAQELELDGTRVAESLGAVPGTRLELRIGIRDLYPGRDPEQGWSSPASLRVVSGPELKKILAEELVGAHLMIQDIRDDMKRQRTAVQIRKDMNTGTGETP